MFSIKKVVLKIFAIFTGKQPCWNLFFGLQVCSTPKQMFSCEYYEIFKNTCFEEHLRAAASESKILKLFVHR